MALSQSQINKLKDKLLNLPQHQKDKIADAMKNAGGKKGGGGAHNQQNPNTKPPKSWTPPSQGGDGSGKGGSGGSGGSGSNKGGSGGSGSRDGSRYRNEQDRRNRWGHLEDRVRQVQPQAQRERFAPVADRAPVAEREPADDRLDRFRERATPVLDRGFDAAVPPTPMRPMASFTPDTGPSLSASPLATTLEAPDIGQTIFDRLGQSAAATALRDVESLPSPTSIASIEPMASQQSLTLPQPAQMRSMLEGALADPMRRSMLTPFKEQAQNFDLPKPKSRKVSVTKNELIDSSKRADAARRQMNANPINIDKNELIGDSKKKDSGGYIVVMMPGTDGRETPVLVPQEYVDPDNLPDGAYIPSDNVITDPDVIESEREKGRLLDQQDPSIVAQFTAPVEADESDTDSRKVSVTPDEYRNDPEPPLTPEVLAETDPGKAALMQQAGIEYVGYDEMVVRNNETGELTVVESSEEPPEGYSIFTYGGDSPERERSILGTKEDFIEAVGSVSEFLQEHVAEDAFEDLVALKDTIAAHGGELTKQTVQLVTDPVGWFREHGDSAIGDIVGAGLNIQAKVFELLLPGGLDTMATGGLQGAANFLYERYNTWQLNVINKIVNGEELDPLEQLWANTAIGVALFDIYADGEGWDEVWGDISENLIGVRTPGEWIGHFHGTMMNLGMPGDYAGWVLANYEEAEGAAEAAGGYIGDGGAGDAAIWELYVSDANWIQRGIRDTIGDPLIATALIGGGFKLLGQFGRTMRMNSTTRLGQIGGRVLEGTGRVGNVGIRVIDHASSMGIPETMWGLERLGKGTILRPSRVARHDRNMSTLDRVTMDNMRAMQRGHGTSGMGATGTAPGAAPASGAAPFTPTGGAPAPWGGWTPGQHLTGGALVTPPPTGPTTPMSGSTFRGAGAGSATPGSAAPTGAAPPRATPADAAGSPRATATRTVTPPEGTNPVPTKWHPNPERNNPLDQLAQSDPAAYTRVVNGMQKRMVSSDRYLSSLGVHTWGIEHAIESARILDEVATYMERQGIGNFDRAAFHDLQGMVEDKRAREDFIAADQVMRGRDWANEGVSTQALDLLKQSGLILDELPEGKLTPAQIQQANRFVNMMDNAAKWADNATRESPAFQQAYQRAQDLKAELGSNYREFKPQRGHYRDGGRWIKQQQQAAAQAKGPAAVRALKNKPQLKSQVDREEQAKVRNAEVTEAEKDYLGRHTFKDGTTIVVRRWRDWTPENPNYQAMVQGPDVPSKMSKNVFYASDAKRAYQEANAAMKKAGLGGEKTDFGPHQRDEATVVQRGGSANAEPAKPVKAVKSRKTTKSKAETEPSAKPTTTPAPVRAVKQSRSAGEIVKDAADRKVARTGEDVQTPSTKALDAEKPTQTLREQATEEAKPATATNPLIRRRQQAQPKPKAEPTSARERVRDPEGVGEGGRPIYNRAESIDYAENGKTQWFNRPHETASGTGAGNRGQRMMMLTKVDESNGRYRHEATVPELGITFHLNDTNKQHNRFKVEGGPFDGQTLTLDDLVLKVDELLAEAADDAPAPKPTIRRIGTPEDVQARTPAKPEASPKPSPETKQVVKRQERPKAKAESLEPGVHRNEKGQLEIEPQALRFDEANFQPRGALNAAHVRSLADGWRASDQDPIRVVRASVFGGAADQFIVVSGHHRAHAAQVRTHEGNPTRLRFDEIEVRDADGNLDIDATRKEALRVGASANLKAVKQQLPLDTSNSIATLRRAGMSDADIAREINMTANQVADYEAIGRLPDSLKAILRDNVKYERKNGIESNTVKTHNTQGMTVEKGAALQSLADERILNPDALLHAWEQAGPMTDAAFQHYVNAIKDGYQAYRPTDQGFLFGMDDFAGKQDSTLNLAASIAHQFDEIERARKAANDAARSSKKAGFTERTQQRNQRERDAAVKRLETQKKGLETQLRNRIKSENAQQAKPTKASTTTPAPVKAVKQATEAAPERGGQMDLGAANRPVMGATPRQGETLDANDLLNEPELTPEQIRERELAAGQQDMFGTRPSDPVQAPEAAVDLAAREQEVRAKRAKEAKVSAAPEPEFTRNPDGDIVFDGTPDGNLLSEIPPQTNFTFTIDGKLYEARKSSVDEDGAATYTIYPPEGDAVSVTHLPGKDGGSWYLDTDITSNKQYRGFDYLVRANRKALGVSADFSHPPFLNRARYDATRPAGPASGATLATPRSIAQRNGADRADQAHLGDQAEQVKESIRKQNEIPHDPVITRDVQQNTPDPLADVEAKAETFDEDAMTAPPDETFDIDEPRGTATYGMIVPGAHLIVPGAKKAIGGFHRVRTAFRNWNGSPAHALARTGIVVDYSGVTIRYSSDGTFHKKGDPVLWTAGSDIPWTERQVAELTKITDRYGNTLFDIQVAAYKRIKNMNPKLWDVQAYAQSAEYARKWFDDDFEVRNPGRKMPAPVRALLDYFDKLTAFRRERALFSWFRVISYPLTQFLGNGVTAMLSLVPEIALDYMRQSLPGRKRGTILRESPSRQAIKHLAEYGQMREIDPMTGKPGNRLVFHDPLITAHDVMMNALGRRTLVRRNDVYSKARAGLIDPKTGLPTDALMTNKLLAKVPILGKNKVFRNLGGSRAISRMGAAFDMAIRESVAAYYTRTEFGRAAQDYRNHAISRLEGWGYTRDAAIREWDAFRAKATRKANNPFAMFDYNDVMDSYGGLTVGQRERLARDWQNAVYDIEDRVNRQMDRITFSGPETKADTVLRRMLMFHHFFSRQSWFYARTAMEHPFVYNIGMNFYENVWQDLDEDILPESMRGWLKLPFVGPIAGTLLVFSPGTLLATWLTFNAGDFEFNVENRSAFGDALWAINDKLGINPVLMDIFNLSGYMGDDFEPDPLGIYNENAILMGLLNYGKTHGWFGDNRAPFANFYQDNVSLLRDKISTINLPGNEHIRQTLSKEQSEYQIGLIVLDELHRDGFSDEEAAAMLPGIMSDPTSPYYVKAAERWSEGQVIGTAARFLLGPFRPRAVQVNANGQQIQMYLTDDERRAARTTDPRTAKLMTQADQYYNLGHKWERDSYNLYNQLRYGEIVDPVTINGVTYTPEQIANMNEDERKWFADAFMYEQGLLDDSRRHREKVNNFLSSEANKEFAQYDGWKGKVYDYDDGDDNPNNNVFSYWEEAGKSNPSAKEYYDSVMMDDSLSQHEKESRLTNTYAWYALNGWQVSAWDPVPGDTSTIDGVQVYDPLGIAGTPPRPAEKWEEYAPWQQEIIENTPAYWRQVDRYDRAVKAEMEARGYDTSVVSFEDLHWREQKSIDDALYDQGISDPTYYLDEYEGVEDYVEWVAEQPEGADISYDAYFAYTQEKADKNAADKLEESINNPVPDDVGRATWDLIYRHDHKRNQGDD